MDLGPTHGGGARPPEHDTVAMKHDEPNSGLFEPGMVGKVAISQ
jgi:hypothetical protein